MSMLAFFPWLQISDAVRVEEFELLPYQRGIAPSGRATKEQSVFDRLLNPYYSGGTPIRIATIVRIAGQDPTRNMSSEERSALFVFSEVLSAAGLAAREFFGFGLNYQNRDNFRLVIQCFDSDRGGSAITTRRRDGSTSNYCTEDSYRVQKPEHIPSHRPNSIDFPLLCSLMASRDSQDWERFYEAILGFNLANTDSPDISEHAEAVLLIGAFERILECHHGKEDELAERFSATLTPTEDKELMSCTQLSGLTNRFNKSHFIRDIWIRDFFRLRGDLAHGKIKSRYRPVWSLQNHLLLGSFVFPLLVKSKLRSIEAYLMTDHDQESIDVFEPQACEDHFALVADRDDLESYPWDRVYLEVKKQRLRRSLMTCFKKQFDNEQSGGNA